MSIECFSHKFKDLRVHVVIMVVHVIVSGPQERWGWQGTMALRDPARPLGFQHSGEIGSRNTPRRDTRDRRDGNVVQIPHIVTPMPLDQVKPYR